MAELIVENVTHAYDNITVLEKIDFTAASGSITCVLGVSGSGKTTLMRLIGGFERLSQGKITIQNHVVSSSYDGISIAPEKRQIGMMFQDYALFPHLTIQNNLLFGLKKNNHACIDWVLDAAKRLGLGKLLNKYSYELSGGEQQRVALLRAIAPEPKLLLLDEPFNGLDPHLRRQMRDEVITFIRNVGVTTMVVTHDPEEASYMGDQLLILDQGRVSQMGSPANVRKMPSTPMVADFFGAVNHFKLKVEAGKIHLPIFQEPIDVNSNLSEVTVQFYPESIMICEGDDFTFVQRFMVEYGGERMVFEHQQTQQRFIVHCSQMCPQRIGDKVGLMINSKNVLIF